MHKLGKLVDFRIGSAFMRQDGLGFVLDRGISACHDELFGHLPPHPRKAHMPIRTWDPIHIQGKGAREIIEGSRWELGARAVRNDLGVAV
jgi:hypothetical protein